MDLVLEMCNTRSIHWCGVSGRQLGKVSPSASLSLPLKLLSSVQGLQVGAHVEYIVTLSIAKAYYSMLCYYC
jgi:hypothetical protein